MKAHMVSVTYRFQSTLPRGERLANVAKGDVLWINFNPRSHEGSDYDGYVAELHKGISIHAPTRGATAIFAKKFSFLSAKIV